MKLHPMNQRPPDFVNGEGVKWWAMNSQGLWAVELPTGEHEYVGILKGRLVANGTALDAVASKMEFLALCDSEER
ncbi:hypothetical protein R2362_02960 [Mycobacteroides chelonae]|nr:hypothetical protein [Mycobacteroides chelonae]